jgi:hypothetical protein
MQLQNCNPLTPPRKPATPEDMQESEDTNTQESQGFQFINQTGGKIKDPAIKKLVRQNAISRKYYRTHDHILAPRCISKRPHILKVSGNITKNCEIC